MQFISSISYGYHSLRGCECSFYHLDMMKGPCPFSLLPVLVWLAQLLLSVQWRRLLSYDNISLFEDSESTDSISLSN